MKTIYFHVGMYKTGTSFLQRFCRNNFEQLAQNNIYYPKITRVQDGSHYGLLDAITDTSKTENVFNALTNEIEQCGCDNILMSLEHLINSCDSEKFIKPLLAPFARHQVKIIIYFRRQDNYLESLYNQEAKQWFAGSIEEYYQRMIANNTQVNAHQFNYDFIVTRLIENFGKENVIIKTFEPVESENWLLHSFFHIFGLHDFKAFSMPKLGNESIKREMLLFLNKLGDSGGHEFYKIFGGWQNPAVIKFLEYTWSLSDTIAGNKHYFLSPQRRKEICEYYAASNAAVAKIYLGREDGILFDKPLPDVNEPWQEPGELSTQTLAEIMAAFNIKFMAELTANSQKLLALDQLVATTLIELQQEREERKVLEEYKKQLDAIKESSSWKLTAPLRYLVDKMRRLLPAALRSQSQ